MYQEELLEIKRLVGIEEEDATQDFNITNTIMLVLSYTNRKKMIPELTYFVADKIKRIMAHESNGGTLTGTGQVKSISDGMTSITYDTDSNNTGYDFIYGLSEGDKAKLRLYRRVM